MISERQKLLLQRAAFCLVDNLRISTDEAIVFLATALRDELNRQKTTFESLELANKSERSIFVRLVVSRLEDHLTLQQRWPEKAIHNSTQAFLKMLQSKWLLAG